VKHIAPVLAAGGTFAGCTLAGLLGGAWLGRQTGWAFWVLLGLVGGMAAGAYSAFRLLMQSL
jgi:hypothetical protein